MDLLCWGLEFGRQSDCPAGSRLWIQILAQQQQKQKQKIFFGGQWDGSVGKVFVAKPDDLSLVPGAPMMEGKEWTPACCMLFFDFYNLQHQLWGI